MALVPLALVAGCGSVSQVVQQGQDTYFIASQGVVGNGSAGAETARALQAAAEFCKGKGLLSKALNIKTVDPFFGRAPSSELTFTCEPGK
jgi:hypothetical protein